jgi:hypothetical protein
VTLLTAKTLDLCHGNTLNSDFREGGPHVVELEGLDDGNDHFHANQLLRMGKDAVLRREMHELLHYSRNVRVSLGARASPPANKKRCGFLWNPHRRDIAPTGELAGLPARDAPKTSEMAALNRAP